MVGSRKNTTPKCYLINMTFPSDKNISAEEIDKLSNYKILEKEVARFWHIITRTFLMSVGALGTIKQNADKQIKKTIGKLSLSEIQKIVLMSAAYTL